jgi:hypothetical protein
MFSTGAVDAVGSARGVYGLHASEESPPAAAHHEHA